MWEAEGVECEGPWNTGLRGAREDMPRKPGTVRPEATYDRGVESDNQTSGMRALRAPPGLLLRSNVRRVSLLRLA